MSDAAQQTTQSAQGIEAEIAATRAHLATTVDELVARAQPKEIVRRQGESARIAFAEATRGSGGELRVGRIVGVVSAVAALVLVVAALRRHRH
ncbi:MAG: DUF3618 domain-containing protein [Actinomycetota bacterium]|nr:DUF3618 domain-containing protein [Actinomycetota bacterium]